MPENARALTTRHRPPPGVNYFCSLATVFFLSPRLSPLTRRISSRSGGWGLRGTSPRICPPAVSLCGLALPIVITVDPATDPPPKKTGQHGEEPRDESTAAFGSTFIVETVSLPDQVVFWGGAAGALVSEEGRSCSAVKPARSAGQRLGSDRRGALPGLVVSPARQILSSMPWPSAHRPLRLALGIGPARLRRDPRGSAPRPQTRLDILALKATNKPQRLAALAKYKSCNQFVVSLYGRERERMCIVATSATSRMQI